VCTNRHLFLQTGLKKNVGTIHFTFGGRLGVSQTGADNRLRSNLTDFFISNISALENRKKGFYASRLPNNEEITVDGFLYEAAKKLNSFQNIKIKI
jgi:hypothetical protein